MTNGLLPLSSSAMDRELHRIGQWWLDHAIDREHGGFVGELNNVGEAIPGAVKGVILNTRILWFFSEAFLATQKPEYGEAAQRAFAYILEHFIDREHGGLFWEVGPSGDVTNPRKQTYGQAFGLYAFSSFYKVSKDHRALALCDDIFELIEEHAKDKSEGGYLEGFSRDWIPLDDMRLSEVDANSPKSMNTHLHILEAYTNYMRVSRNPDISSALSDLLHIMDDKIIRTDGRMSLFFGNDWTVHSRETSFGHDIEASWLLREAVDELDDVNIGRRLHLAASNMAWECLNEGMHRSGYVINEVRADGSKDISSKWWVQAEALVGYLQMYQVTGTGAFLEAADRVWKFIQEQHLDLDHGEWLWDARQDAVSAHRDYKAGAWKGPYHNGRSMMEAGRMLRAIEAAQGREIMSQEVIELSNG